MKVEVTQKTTLEVLSQEPLKVRVFIEIGSKGNGLSFVKVVSSLEEIFNFFSGCIPMIDEFGGEQLSGFMNTVILGGKNEKPTA